MADFSNLKIDFDDLELDEIEIMEDISGIPFDEFQQKGMKKAKTLKALAFIAARRIDPDVTLEEVGKIKMSALAGDDDEDSVPKD